jgi:hypothetical protein
MPSEKVNPASPSVRQWIIRTVADGKILRRNGDSSATQRSTERRLVMRFLGNRQVRTALRDEATIRGNAGLLAFLGAWELREKDPGKAAKLLREAGAATMAPAPSSPNASPTGPMRKSLNVPKQDAGPVARRSTALAPEPEPAVPSEPVSTKKDYLTTGGGCDDDDLGHS